MSRSAHDSRRLTTCLQVLILGCAVVSIAVIDTGCSAVMPVPVETQPSTNPFLLPIGANPKNFERTWERCVDVLHQYKFAIERENRPAGTIETEYKVGAGILEPWHPDSVGTAARLESTFQSIRRKIIIRVLREDEGAGYLVGVEAFKEREDTGPGVANTPGGGTFNEYGFDEDEFSKAIDDAEFSGWVPLGHDLVLERDLLSSLQIALRQ